MNKQLEALIRRLKIYAEEFSYPVLSPDDCVLLIAAQQQNKELQTKLDATEAVALALRDDMRGAEKRIAELEASKLGLPEGIHPDTATLVINFAEALAAKLRKAEIKYGYDSDWKKDGWQGQCLVHFHQHIGKGDPLDVAAYCAFMWHHKWPTAASPLAVKLPESFYPDGDIECPKVMNEYEVIEAIRAAGGTVEGE